LTFTQLYGCTSNAHSVQAFTAILTAGITIRRPEIAALAKLKATILTIGRCCVVAVPRVRVVTGVVGARVAVGAVFGGCEAPIVKIWAAVVGVDVAATPVVGALVAVVTHETQAHVFRANAISADTGLTIPVAGTTSAARRPSDARTVGSRRRVVRAHVAVVARVLFADAGHADAVKALIEVAKTIEVASGIVGNVVARASVAPIIGACVLVVALLVGQAFRRRLFTAPHQRHRAQRADT
jgi:hypothetical protein